MKKRGGEALQTEPSDIRVLTQFLNAPLSDGTELLERFRCLPGAVYGQGGHPLERFCYVPGKRKDRVLLLAHCDTVWDKVYCPPVQMRQELLRNGNVLYSGARANGIGADDRAGCALLWLLRESGHSLLLLDGEEHGHFGARFLRDQYPALLREMNRHAYFLQLDLWGECSFMSHGVPNSAEFHRMLNDWGFKEEDTAGGTDISYLCRSVCGANLSVGYRDYHTPKETLNLSAWQRIYGILEQRLSQPQKRCCVRIAPRLYRWGRRLIGGSLRRLRRNKKDNNSIE